MAGGRGRGRGRGAENSNQLARGGKRPIGSRRSWTPREEAFLINCLKEMMMGWKSENGWKTGYLSHIENKLHAAFPGCELKAHPHINSKLHVWKKDFGSLFTMKATSGFGWDHIKKCIVVESDDVWNQYIKVDSNARTMRYKSFPMFDDWALVFGKDRATGEFADDGYVPVAVNPENEEVRQDVPMQDVDWDNLGDYFEDNNEVNSFSATPTPVDVPIPDPSINGSANTSNSRKRKAPEGMDKLVSMMGTFCNDTKTALDKISTRMGYDMDAAAARKNVFEELGTMPFLSLTEKVKLTRDLIKDPKDVDMFFSLPYEGKVEMVRLTLADLIG